MSVEGIKTVAVLGAGTMGNGIAHVFARSGCNVILRDVEQRFLDVGGIDGGVDFRARSDTQGRHTSRQGMGRAERYLLFLRPCVIVLLEVFNWCWF